MPFAIKTSTMNPVLDEEKIVLSYPTKVYWPRWKDVLGYSLSQERRREIKKSSYIYTSIQGALGVQVTVLYRKAMTQNAPHSSVLLY